MQYYRSDFRLLEAWSPGTNVGERLVGGYAYLDYALRIMAGSDVMAKVSGFKMHTMN